MEKLEQIAIIHTDFKEKFGIPRNSGRSPSSIGVIEFLPKFSNPDCFRGLEDFSHIWILFDFSLSHREQFSPTVRPPRLGGNTKVGVFASRSPFRPNNIGLSVCKIESINLNNNPITIKVSGVDILDNTPIYDIKPYIPFADCITNAKGGYADENSNHKLNVVFNCDTSLLSLKQKNSLLECLSDDPRPSYQDDERIYGMKFADFEIKFSVNGNTLCVIKIENI